MPEGWVSLTIQDVCDINPPKPKKGDIPDETPVTFVPMPAVDAERGEISSPEIRPFSEVRSGFTAFRDGDVIMAKITPCMENGKAAIAGGLVSGLGFGSTEFFVLRSNDSILPQYLFHYIRQVSFRELAESNMTGSVGQKRVPKEFIVNAAIPLPPLAEQHRIVAAIEALFARLDAANARLERVPGILKQFRQAVLAAACDGRLTEDWRAGSPQDWLECKVVDIAQVKVGGTPSRKKPQFWNGTIPWVSSGEVANNHIHSTREHITELGLENSNAKIYPKGTILIAMIGEGKTRGQSAYLEIEACTNQNVAGIVPDIQKITSDFLWYWSLSKYEDHRKAGRGGEQPALNKKIISEMQLSLPPLPEQNEIVRRVEALLALTDRIEAEVAAARAKTETMRQSILAQAFSGRLVPTEAGLARREGREYEPASVLLERIHSEKKEKTGRRGTQSTLV